MDNDGAVVKKTLKTLNLFLFSSFSLFIYSEKEINAKKLISKLIKVCGVDGAKSCCFPLLMLRAITEKTKDLIGDKELADELLEAAAAYNWPKWLNYGLVITSVITSIEDQLKPEQYVRDADSVSPVGRR